jgi:hypothetical protein
VWDLHIKFQGTEHLLCILQIIVLVFYFDYWWWYFLLGNDIGQAHILSTETTSKFHAVAITMFVIVDL